MPTTSPDKRFKLVILPLAGISEEPAFNMVVNRPYLCLIRHNVTQAILFSGIVFNPKR